MTEPTWKYWIPERDGHAPDDWAEGTNAECLNAYNAWVDAGPYPWWIESIEYRYRPLQDETYEPDLLAQCLALPQDKREALIEAMQKPQRDWADDVWDLAWSSAHESPVHNYDKAGAAVIRSMCRPREDERIQAAERIIEVIHSAGVSNLSRGVQLGAVSWSVKMNDALAWYKDAKAALS